MKTAQTNARTAIAVGASPLVVTEPDDFDPDGRIVCNTGTGTCFVGLGEPPTSTAHEYRLDPGVSLAIPAGSGVRLHLVAPGGTTVSVKGYRS